MDEFTEVSHQSLGSRLMESIKGVAIGVVLFLLAFPVLWWNEGRAVSEAKSLERVSCVLAFQTHIGLSRPEPSRFERGTSEIFPILCLAASRANPRSGLHHSSKS